MRGYYLAALAHLAGRNLVAPARHKSNLDYQRELLRRARDRPPLTEAFSNSVRVFDRVWYGNYRVDESVLDEFRGYLEAMRTG